MRALLFASFVLPLLLPLNATAQTFHGRGVYTFDAAAACPLAGVGPIAPRACNRIALDDDASTVVLDRAAHRIVFKNAKRYESKQIVGDVLISGWGMLPSGERVPLAVHLLVKKDGNTFHAKPHAHAVTRDSTKSVEIDGFTVVLDDGTHLITALTPESGRKAIADPGLAAKMADELVEVRDTLQRRPTSDAPVPVADVTVAIGIGRLAKDVVRAQLFAGNGQRTSSVIALLKSGSWELRITPLSSLIPKEVFRRDLFLYGVESVKTLSSVEASGLEKGATLAFAMRAGHGRVELGGASTELPHLETTARAFLEQSFLGAILEHQAEHALGRQ